VITDRLRKRADQDALTRVTALLRQGHGYRWLAWLLEKLFRQENNA